MTNIKIGDVVKLKSGGPRMTVEQIDSDGVICVWFNTDKDGSNTSMKATFHPATLGPA